MNGGVIVGGWNFVIAAYVLTGTGLIAYAVSLFMRNRNAQRH